MSRWEHPAFRQPRWEEGAACKPHPTSWWFADSPDAVEAFVVCAGCDVKSACLAFALDRPDLLGIWGATTSEDRARLRRARRESGVRRPSE